MTTSRMTVAELHKKFAYDPESGELMQRMAKGRLRVVGTIHDAGHLSVRPLGRVCLVHVIAWALHYGAYSEVPITHINRDKADNRIVNLRPRYKIE